MEYKCNVCGNVFDDVLGTCPACGTAVVAAESQPVQEQSAYQPQPDAQQSQPAQEQSAYQPQPDAQQAQPNYQQPPYQGGYQQQPNYQQPPYQGGYQQPPYGYKDPNAKSKIAAGLLGIFLGALGVHNFYLGYTGKAIGQLLITILSCGILSGISAIWGLIEGIMILTGSIGTDSTGRPLSD